ncbi:hypothetical protein QEH59_00105 [Coraliomargarita sp. SDUM461004]|uniref:Alginate lyase 2 domain-containing protein n=1 Tax=Thalassobacterium sedimentorum TaxID=3041258 RepID=A0ABU1ADM2_9BACT|nr:hypothetical protein [Coraliomargarita sp. SDUM461004]MDQ8192804.1 hypothetical protein [Coraliomargarita sp. SDUM461004]
MRNRILTILAITISAALQHSAATPIYSETFDNRDDKFPQGWFDSSHGTLTPKVVEIRNNALYMSRPDQTNDSAATRNALYAGSGSSELTDYTVEAYFKNNHVANRSGVIVRWQDDSITNSNTLKGYLATIYNNEIYISKDSNPNGGFNHPDYLLATNKLNRPIFGDQKVRITFTVSGSTLTARGYIKSRTGDFDRLIGEVTTTDKTYQQGSAGVMSRFLYRGRSTRWDDFSITEISGSKQ